jgi:hypothetical protein
LEIIKWVFAISGANTVKNKPKPIVNWPLEHLKTRKLQLISYRDDWKVIRHVADFDGYDSIENGLHKMLCKKNR